jgi:pyruvate,water dikinase
VVVLGCAPPEQDPCGPGAALDEPSGACFCEPGFFGDPYVECPPHADVCAEASERMQHLVCTHTIDDEAQWTRQSVGAGTGLGGIRRMGKYLVPVEPSARLPTVLPDANAYRLHLCLMSVGFAPQFPGLTAADYAELILTHAGREFYAGSIYELQTPNPLRFGFTLETANRPEEMLAPEAVYAVYRQLADRFAPGMLGYVPFGTMQQDTAQGWVDPPFEILAVDAEEVPYEVYTPGIAYGRVRLRPAGQLTDAAFGWQDIVVFGEVPVDLEGVVGAAVTAQRQDILSHLNVLSAQRGTPNVFVDDAIAAFEQFEGELVRLEAQPNGYTLTAATEAEAEAHWQQARPAIAVENPAQLDYAELDAFAEIPTETQEQRAQARARFGAKSVGLAILWRLLEPSYRTPGLAVPFHYYDEFMTSNMWEVDLGDGPALHSYAETLAAWLEDDEFRTDAAVRKDRLERLREQMQAYGVVSPELVQALRGRIVEVFGSDTVMVRVRSSSNAEDNPSFNGAGLYDSTSACAADSAIDADGAASACDPGKDPRPLERGLAEVWSSLWSFGAFEERDYYQLDHTRIAMGATISLRYEGELANGVALTGDPIDPRRDRYTVDAQLGEVDVVSPTPGVTAELSFLTLADGEVVEIERAVASTLVASGQTVLSDAQLRELGAVMAGLADAYPVDTLPEAGGSPILDLEFKIESDGQLAIKQIRTFTPSPYTLDSTCLGQP